MLVNIGIIMLEMDEFVKSMYPATRSNRFALTNKHPVIDLY